VGLRDFDRIDLVATAPDGGARWIMVAGNPWQGDEALRIAQFLVKLAGYEQHAAHQDQPVTIELVSREEPPACVLEIMRRKGHKVERQTDDGRAPVTGYPAAFELGSDGWPDVGALQAANARAFAARYELAWPPTLEAVAGVDRVLAAARDDAGLDDDETSDDAIDGDLIVLGGAYAGEAIRAEVGHRWRYDASVVAMRPIYLAAGPDGGNSVNVLGKVVKYLTSGSADSVHHLARAVVDMVRRESAR
jgi:hypothetical protein